MCIRDRVSLALKEMEIQEPSQINVCPSNTCAEKLKEDEAESKGVNSPGMEGGEKVKERRSVKVNNFMEAARAEEKEQLFEIQFDLRHQMERLKKKKMEEEKHRKGEILPCTCLLYTSPSPRD
eukprot:TRINITY_DN23553_c0_g1_i1.p1 TRINITY_DN23553_c0_g1~~TRINITY_DN23553_c0_g1_i1.p1  ORF type:complete len:123 (+),score=49.78 TRINITY_DN23553_c0_g1_i1:67-435(+)